MIILATQGLQKSFGINEVIREATLTVQDGMRLGMVGSNGAGKSTLLKILAGLETPSGGEVFRQKGLRIGYHAQLDELNSQKNLWDEMEEVFAPVFAMEQKLRAMEEKMGEIHNDPEAFERLAGEYQRLTDRYEQAGGYSWRSTIQGVLTGLGFGRDRYEQPIDQFSGGERTRLKLAKLLLVPTDLLLLDEPTNHLDLPSTAWLEGYLKEYRGAVIVVSHDRYFLDAVCTDMAELFLKRLTQYHGNYSRYLAQREAELERRMKEYELQQRDIEREKAIIARYRSYSQEWSMKAAKSREKRLEMVEVLEKPMEEKGVYMNFRARTKTGQDVLIAKDLQKSFGTRNLFSGINLHVRAGERVALIGPNGIGKTTLLRILLGEEMPDQGFIQMGSGVQIGYYDQQQKGLHPEKTVLDEIWDRFPRMEQTDVRNSLAAFLFQGDDVFQPISTLSGGERGRVLLTNLMLRGDNFLILDEPTNHLDMDSCEVLEAALQDFQGTILTVSHDRFFINRIATRVVVLSENGTQEFTGNYDDYVEKLKILSQQEEQVELSGVTKTAQAKEKKKEREAQLAMQKERDAVAALEQRIADLEKELADLERKMAEPESYRNPEQAASLGQQYKELQRVVGETYKEWETAAEALADKENTGS